MSRTNQLMTSIFEPLWAIRPIIRLGAKTSLRTCFEAF